jgi:hypothetical protein
MADYYATTQVSVNTADEGQPRKIDYLPPFKKAPQNEWEDALGEDQFESFVEQGVLVEVTKDTKVDQNGFIHFQRIGAGSSVVDDPNAPPDEEVANSLTEEDVATAEAQRDGTFTGKPPGLGTEEKPEDERTLAESGTAISREADSVRAEETAAKTAPPTNAPKADNGPKGTGSKATDKK